VQKSLIKLADYAKRNRFLDIGLRYNPLYYNSVRRLIHDLEEMDVLGRRALSERLLSRSLGWAKATPARRNLDQPFSHWPVLEKDALRDNEGKFRKPNLVAIPHTTSGSTGRPIRIWRSLRCVAAEQAFIDSLLEPFNLTFRSARIAWLRSVSTKAPSDLSPPFGTVTRGGSHLMLSPRHISPDTIQWFTNAINEFAPDILWVWPNAAELLARHVLEEGLEVHVPLVLCSSELLSRSGRRMLSEAFHARVVSYYGLAERVAFATTTEEGQCFFNPAYGRIELRPVKSMSSSPDAVLMEVIATGFWNDSMPLVKFRTGDYLSCPASYDERDIEGVELGLKPFISISGRDSDYLESPRGKIFIDMSALARNTKNILRIQIIQESLYAVRADVLPKRILGKADQKALSDNISLCLPTDMRVEISSVDKLEVSAAGKTPYVIRRLDPADDKYDAG
jgi:phenylacetate-CoA ligase